MKKLCLFVLLFLLGIPANEQALPVNLSLPIKKEVKTSKVINDLSVLHPAFRNKVIEFIAACNKAGVQVRVYETYRDSIRQDSLYYQKRKVTNARPGYSKHQYGLAIDIYPVRRTRENWKKMIEIGESFGLKSGSRWKSIKDYPHFEYDISTEKLIAGNRPDIPDIVIIPI